MSKRSGRVASRRESCSTLLMIVLTRSELFRMISVSLPLLGPDRRALGEQLAGMAHRAHGVANLMGDARREATERRELALLHALRHEARVLEKDQRRAGRRVAERRKMRLDDPCAVGRDEVGRRPLVALALAPRAQGIQ